MSPMVVAAPVWIGRTANARPCKIKTKVIFIGFVKAEKIDLYLIICNSYLGHSAQERTFLREHYLLPGGKTDQ
ncbi:hypothetical protein MNBD_DELTA04-717 [hydrothermal vent metagenome]|uniref:Uncharacterized protein n=1 Tax=hydrothermal vent metagenome TaxID=652676 RepID=A0A3B0VC20_9ZZZZ